MRPYVWAVMVLVVSSVVSLGQAPPPGDYATVVKARFASWDRNKDGKLVKEEIDRAVADPSVTGSEAAAIVAIRRGTRSKSHQLPPLTLPTLLAPAKAGVIPDFPELYGSSLARIAKARRELFPAGKPSLNEFRQGKLGDCFCLAAMGAMVSRDPADVVKMITPKADGSFVVRLGAKEVIVPAPTDAELALTASGGDGGFWINVYEKAIALHRAASVKAGDTPPSLIDLLAKGGSAGATIEVITGNKIERFPCKFARDPGVSEAERKEKLAELRKRLTQAFADRRLVTTGTNRGAETPPGIHTGHAYAVVGYDAKTDRIALWNPHGQTFTPKGEPGYKTGYTTRDGRFEMPLPEFVRAFAGLAFETTTAAN